MLYLRKRPFRANRQTKDAPYLVPSMRKTGDVKSSTNNDHTRISTGRCESLTAGDMMRVIVLETVYAVRR